MIELSAKCMQFLRQLGKVATDMYSNPKLNKKDVDLAIGKSLVDAATTPSLRAQLSTIIRNNYLSALPTFIKNFAGNFGRLIEAPLARIAGGRPSEAVDMIVGYAKAFTKVFPRFAEGFSNKSIELDGRTAKEYDIYLKLPGQDPNKFLDMINRPINAVLTFPQSVQRGGDEFFAVMFEQAQLEVLKNRAKNSKLMPDSFFTNRGITRDEWMRQVEDALAKGDTRTPLWKTFQDIEPRLAAEIEDFQKYGTYRSDLGSSIIDRATRSYSNFAKDNPLASLFTPFIITPTNIAKFGAGYVPGLGLLRFKQGLKDINVLRTDIDDLIVKQAEAKTPKSAERIGRLIEKKQGQLQFKKDLNRDFIGQQILGTGLVAYAYGLVADDRLTGEYSLDPEIRTRQIASGKPPSSIRLGDRWVGFAGIEPLHTILSLTANTLEAVRDGRLKGQELTAYAGDFAKVIKAAFLDKTFTEGLSNVMGAMEDPDKIPSTIVALTNGLTPNILNNIARIEDKVAREVRDPELSTWILNNLKSRLPGQRADVPVQYDVAGQPRQLGSTGELLTGFINRPAEQTIAQSFFNNPELKIKMPSRTVFGVELKGEQYERMSKMMGEMTNTVAASFASNPGFQRLPDSLKAELFTNVVSTIRSNVRLMMLPEIVQDPKQRVKFIAEEFQKRGLNPYSMGINIE